MARSIAALAGNTRALFIYPPKYCHSPDIMRVPIHKSLPRFN